VHWYVSSSSVSDVDDGIGSLISWTETAYSIGLVIFVFDGFDGIMKE
jgi:hypothetical protein